MARVIPRYRISGDRQVRTTESRPHSMWESPDETVGASLVGAQCGDDRANGNNRATTRVAPTLGGSAWDSPGIMAARRVALSVPDRPDSLGQPPDRIPRWGSSSRQPFAHSDLALVGLLPFAAEPGHALNPAQSRRQVKVSLDPVGILDLLQGPLGVEEPVGDHLRPGRGPIKGAPPLQPHQPCPAPWGSPNRLRAP